MLILCNPASAQDSSGQLPVEINVPGPKLFRILEQQIREAEDHMYALFNELNGDDYYDITCQWEQRTGTKIPQRVCRPAFLRQATTAEANSFLSRTSGFSENFAGPPPQSVASYHYPILEEKLKEVITENEEFLNAVMHHHELQQELEQKKSSFFKKDD